MKRFVGALLIAIALSAPAAEVGALDTQGDPTKYVGDWTGVVTTNAGGEAMQVDLTLAYDNGSISGSIAYPTLGCSGELDAPDNQLRTTATGQVVSSGGEGVLTIAHLDGGNGSSLCSSDARFTVAYYDAAYFGVETLVVNQTACGDPECATPGAGTTGSAHGSVQRPTP
jgi:hypothetical protein